MRIISHITQIYFLLSITATLDAVGWLGYAQDNNATELMNTYAIGSKMSREDYEKFLSLRGRLLELPEQLAESQFISELKRKGYDFMDYFGAHYLFS